MQWERKSKQDSCTSQLSYHSKQFVCVLVCVCTVCRGDNHMGLSHVLFTAVNGSRHWGPLTFTIRPLGDGGDWLMYTLSSSGNGIIMSHYQPLSHLKCLYSNSWNFSIFFLFDSKEESVSSETVQDLLVYMRLEFEKVTHDISDMWWSLSIVTIIALFRSPLWWN